MASEPQTSTHHKVEKDCRLGDYSTSHHVPRWRAWVPVHWPMLWRLQINTSQPNKHISWQTIHSGWREWKICPSVTGSLQWSRRCWCRSLHQFPHFLSVVLHVYPENQQHFLLLTSLKGQKITQNSSQNTNISRRVFDITGPERNNYVGFAT